MTLDAFIDSHAPETGDEVAALCRKGLARMANSRDPLHDDRHVARLLETVALLVSHERLPEINYQVLVLAICWHDTWKATRFPSTVMSLLFDQYWDGYGSYAIFRREAKGWGVEESVVREAGLILREHGNAHFFRPRTVEADIFYDVDALEAWSVERIRSGERKFASSSRRMARAGLLMANFYYKRFMLRESPSRYRFAWSRAEFLVRKAAVAAEFDRIRAAYSSYL